MWLLRTIVSCLLGLSSVKKFSVFHQSNNTCTAGHWSETLCEIYTLWVVLHDNVLLQSALRWVQNEPNANDCTIQMSHVHLKWHETIWYTMTRQINTLRIPCLNHNKNYPNKTYENLAKRGTSSVIHVLITNSQTEHQQLKLLCS
jgi:hypothetical protein